MELQGIQYFLVRAIAKVLLLGYKLFFAKIIDFNHLLYDAHGIKHAGIPPTATLMYKPAGRRPWVNRLPCLPGKQIFQVFQLYFHQIFMFALFQQIKQSTIEKAAVCPEKNLLHLLGKSGQGFFDKFTNAV